MKIGELMTLREREDHIEFKAAQHNYPFAGGKKSDPRDRRHCVLGYVVALANERGGRLVLGMADAYPHIVVGSDFAKSATGALEDEIYERLRIRVRTEELYDEKSRRVLVINVPSRPIGKALRFEGVPLMRIGESLREMDDSEYFSILSEQDPDFSARICEGLTIDDLDDEAIANMRRLITEKRNRAGTGTAPLERLLSDLRLISGEGLLTYAALLLIGKSESITKYLPQANVVIEYRNSRSHVRYDARQEYRLPLFVAIDKIWEYINQPACNPLVHINDYPRIIDCPMFNKETIREAVINAAIHRSLQITSDIFIKIYPDAIEISNPGGFPFGVNIDNILTVSSSPRCRLMAEVIEKTGLIERSGQGVDIMFANCVKEGKSLPDYSKSDDYQVNLSISGEITDNAFYLFVQDVLADKRMSDQMNTFDWLTLYYVWQGNVKNVYVDSVSKLIELELVEEDDYFKYVLGKKYLTYKQEVKRIVSRINLDYLQKIFYVVKRSGNASMNDLIQEFDGLLTPKQVRTLVASFVDLQILSVRGNARATKYVWNE